MIMTDEQKYNAVLKELGELLQSKNTTISCQKWQIDQLKEKLEAAEKERDEWHDGWRVAADQRDDALIQLQELEAAEKEREEACNEENKRGDGKTYWLLDKESIDTLRAVNATLRKCYDQLSGEFGCFECVNQLETVQLVLASVLPFEEGAA